MAVAKDFYVYTETFLDLENSTTQSGNIDIQADSDFQLQKLTVSAQVSLGTQYTVSTEIIPSVAILITDSGSGRNLFEAAIPVSTVFGNGRLPFILPTAKLFPARSTITLNVSNFATDSEADIARIDFAFIGYKIFRTGQ